MSGTNIDIYRIYKAVKTIVDKSSYNRRIHKY